MQESRACLFPSVVRISEKRPADCGIVHNDPSAVQHLLVYLVEIQRLIALDDIPQHTQLRSLHMRVDVTNTFGSSLQRDGQSHLEAQDDASHRIYRNAKFDRNLGRHQAVPVPLCYDLLSKPGGKHLRSASFTSWCTGHLFTNVLSWGGEPVDREPYDGWRKTTRTTSLHARPSKHRDQQNADGGV